MKARVVQTNAEKMQHALGYSAGVRETQEAERTAMARFLRKVRRPKEAEIVERGYHADPAMIERIIANEYGGGDG